MLLKNIVYFLFLSFFLIGCGDSKPVTKTSIIKTPLKTTAAAQAKLFADTATLDAGESLALRADESPYISEYQWWDEKGDLLSNASSTEWTAPNQAGLYTITLTVIDLEGNYTHQSINITVTAVDVVEEPIEIIEPESPAEEPKEPTTPVVPPSSNSSFSAIHTLLSQANQGTLSNVTYICIGDSTRAESKYQGQYLFYELQSRLRGYNVTSHLLARAGHQATQFDTASNYPSWQDAVSRIPANGATTIVDICLGINDYWDIAPSAIKPHIKSAIAKIRSSKPQTHFVLTMPDRVYNNETMTNDLKRIYQELSSELQLPLNNVVNGVMPSQASTSYSWYNNDGFNVHMSQSGQSLVAQYILGNMLP